MKRLAPLLLLLSAGSLAYHSASFATLSSSGGTPACGNIPAGGPPLQRIAIQCRGAACHYRAQAAGGASVNQHDVLLAQDQPYEIPIDASVGTVCVVGDASATITAELYQAKP